MTGFFYVLDEPTRILFVDDDPILREFAQVNLETPTTSIDVAADGLEALNILTAGNHDLVLLDLEMPGVDGYEACRRMRCLPGGVELPIVVVTSLDDPGSIERAYAAGATDFVTKPINWVLLVHRVRYVLRAADAAGEILQHGLCAGNIGRAIPADLMLEPVQRKGSCQQGVMVGLSCNSDKKGRHCVSSWPCPPGRPS